jgi:dienelactone hydrolase
MKDELGRSTRGLGLDRRTLLRSAGLAVAGTALARAGKGVAAGLPGRGTSRGDQQVPAASAVTRVPSITTSFFADPTLNFQTLFALGVAGYGVSELGEVLSAVDRTRDAGSSYQAFFDQFLALGQRLAREGSIALRNGRRATARSRYLRSAEYLSQALYFVLGTSQPTRARERAVYRQMQASWDQASQLFAPRFERVKIPYRGLRLPGYLLRPDASPRPRPTVILNNGSDAQNVDLYAFGGAAALERGYNALIFEGPGQGSLLFEHNIPFTPEWERVVRPVMDLLARRSDVDRHRIAIVGWSFCGASVARAAAFDRRLAAVVLDPGVDDYIASFKLGRIQALANEGQQQEVNQLWAEVLARASPATRFTIAKRSEVFAQPTFYDQVRYMERFSLSPGLIGRIRAPTLVMEAEQEQFFPGQSLAVYRQLRTQKRLHRFTTSQGAEYHDEPMAPQARNEVLFGWLDEVLRI